MSAPLTSLSSLFAPFQLDVGVDAVQRLNGSIRLRHAALLGPEEQAVHVRKLHPAPKRKAQPGQGPQSRTCRSHTTAACRCHSA